MSMKHKCFKKFISLMLVFASLLLISNTFVGCKTNSNISISVEPSFGGRSAYVFKNINDEDVKVETFYISQNEQYINNPNIGQAVMLNDAIRYKEAHPNEDVYATITSFHFSVVASVCLDNSSQDYLKMKSLYDCDYDSEGYVRIAYLPIKAAMCGINVIVIGQIDASPVLTAEEQWTNDYSFEEYYKSFLDEETNIEGKLVSDFLNFKVAKWTSYGDKSATDMMHLKSCSVSHYKDINGNEHRSAIWLGSINIDGIDYLGRNGNNSWQTGVIVSGHHQLRSVLYNYTLLLSQYCEQEQIYEFRNLINNLNKQQIDLIKQGKEEEIPESEKIVYLGSKKDNIFELYFTPLGGSLNDWDENYNPFCKYISKLLPENNDKESIVFSWGTAKFKDDSEFSKTLINVLVRAFEENPNIKNRLFLSLPDPDNNYYFEYERFDKLVVGENIGFKLYHGSMANHAKDFQLSYQESGIRRYVSVLNSVNFHQGSTGYQANSFLVIKENQNIGNNVFIDFGKCISQGAIVEAGRIIS